MRKKRLASPNPEQIFRTRLLRQYSRQHQPTAIGDGISIYLVQYVQTEIPQIATLLPTPSTAGSLSPRCLPIAIFLPPAQTFRQ